MRQVILICGPPGAGKTTRAQQFGLAVYDRDEPHWRNEAHFTQALKGIGQDPTARAVVIRAGASISSRKRTATIIRATRTIVLDVDADTCIRRIRERARPGWQGEIAGVRQWWATYTTSTPDRGPDPRSTRAWRKLRDQVVREEPTCWLQYPGRCTGVSTTADHVLTVKDRPDLALVRSNLRGACAPCNWKRNDRPAPSEGAARGGGRWVL